MPQANPPQILLNVVVSDQMTKLCFKLCMLLPHQGAIWAGKPASTILYWCHVILMLFMCIGTIVILENVELLFQYSLLIHVNH